MTENTENMIENASKIPVAKIEKFSIGIILSIKKGIIFVKFRILSMINFILEIYQLAHSN